MKFPTLSHQSEKVGDTGSMVEVAIKHFHISRDHLIKFSGNLVIGVIVITLTTFAVMGIMEVVN